MHSFRIYLACALLAAGASHGTIQTMLRWRSDDALKIYARINDFKYAEWLEKASTAKVSSIRTTTRRDGAALEEAVGLSERRDGAPTTPVDLPGAHLEAVAAGHLPGEAAFAAVWQERAQLAGDQATRDADAERPMTDGDALAAHMHGASDELLAEAERLDKAGRE
jgi:hypothetical protein